MSDQIDKSIEKLAEKIVSDIKPDEALKFTQAALNLAHTKATLAHIKK